MHDFEVGDTVWIRTDVPENLDYAYEHYGGYTGPFIIREIYNPYKKLVAKLNRPDGRKFNNGAFLERLRPDVFMTAARRAVNGAA